MNENDEKLIGAKSGDRIKSESESCKRFLAVSEKYLYMLRDGSVIQL